MRATQAPRRAMQIKALLSLGIVAGLGAVSTLAAWTGNATATATISAGTVALGVGAAPVDTVSYTVPVTGSNWYPGMSQAAMVVVKNAGTLAVPYSVAGSVVESGGGTLGQALNVVVTTGTVQGTAPNATCSGAALLSKEAGAAFPAAVTRPSLNPQANAAFCVQYTLPLTAANTLQGNSTSVKLTFTATIGS